MKVKSIQIKCVFCGLVGGEVQIPIDDSRTTQEELGIIDNRCDTHKTLYGSFKEMVYEAQLMLKIPSSEAEDLVKKNRKRIDFDREMEKRITELEINK